MKVLLERPIAPRDPEREDLAGVWELTCHSWVEMMMLLVPHPVTGQLTQQEHFVPHQQGDLMHLTDAQARYLLGAGSIARPGERLKAELEARQREIEAFQQETDRELERVQQAIEERMQSDADISDQWLAGRNPS